MKNPSISQQPNLAQTTGFDGKVKQNRKLNRRSVSLFAIMVNRKIGPDKLKPKVYLQPENLP